jgi:hypothetical protein
MQGFHGLVLPAFDSWAMARFWGFHPIILGSVVMVRNKTIVRPSLSFALSREKKNHLTKTGSDPVSN